MRLCCQCWADGAASQSGKRLTGSSAGNVALGSVSSEEKSSRGQHFSLLQIINIISSVEKRQSLIIVDSLLRHNILYGCPKGKNSIKHLTVIRC